MDEATPPLLARYRRPLSFGGVLDETFRLYRSAWPRLMAVSALAALPGGVALLALGGSAFFVAVNTLPVRGQEGGAIGRALAGLGAGIFVASLIYGLGVLVWQGAVTAMTGWLARGEEHSVWEALGAALRRLLVLVGSAIVYGLGILALTVVAVPLAVLGVGVLGLLVALIGIAVWVNRRPEDRPGWLPWLVILAFPFGLPLYFGVRWSLAVPALMLERAGPVQALRRSSTLVAGTWFQVFGVWLVLGVVVYILQSIPGAILGLIAALAGVRLSDPQGVALVFNVARSAGSVVGSILFGSLSFIAAAIMFIDLRNRREGVDLAERLDLLAPEPPVVT